MVLKLFHISDLCHLWTLTETTVSALSWASYPSSVSLPIKIFQQSHLKSSANIKDPSYRSQGEEWQSPMTELLRVPTNTSHGTSRWCRQAAETSLCSLHVIRQQRLCTKCKVAQIIAGEGEWKQKLPGHCYRMYFLPGTGLAQNNPSIDRHAHSPE